MVDRLKLLDMSDPAIRMLVESNHNPVETWTISAGGSGVLLSVTCEMCHNQWPCSTITALRIYNSNKSTERL